MPRRKQSRKTKRQYRTRSTAAIAARFHRPEGEADAKEIIFIACEDSHSAPSYLRQVRRELRLSPESVVITGQECGSAPQTVVEYAKAQRDIQKKNASKGIGVAYDHVWCVLDVDQHPKLRQAIADAGNSGIRVALSNPCFEYWLLLHYCDFRKGLAAGANAVRELKKHYPKYEKGKCLFDEFMPYIYTAQQRASDIVRQQYGKCFDCVSCNPSTDIHKLIDCMLNQTRQAT